MKIHPDPDGDRRRPPLANRGGTLRTLRRWLIRAIALWCALTLVPVLLLRQVDPPASSFMMQAAVAAMLKGRENFRLDYRWRDLEAMSVQLGRAVVAAEDQRFAQHRGFDLDAIEKAWKGNRPGRRVRGASTISQQLAKNLFLWPGKSLLRKGIEAWFTVLIEATWPKRRILEVYLNVVQFGDGIYGAEAAAQHYFRKPASELAAAEAALLAAVLPNPLRLKADKPSAYVRSRRDWILVQMKNVETDWIR